MRQINKYKKLKQEDIEEFEGKNKYNNNDNYNSQDKIKYCISNSVRYRIKYQ